jgi:glycosyltransferase involved in cell wall biosynthesis
VIAAQSRTAPIRVMQMIDTLDAGGAERVAVNFANLLPRGAFASWLCTTRRDGPLADLVAGDVSRLALERTRRFDLGLRRLGDVVGGEGIQIIHAHGSSLFVALAAAFRPPYPTVIWHVHHMHGSGDYAPWIYRLFGRRAAKTIAVSHQVAAWVRQTLGFPPDRVMYLPNFSAAGVTRARAGGGDPAAAACAPAPASADALPGAGACRVVSVANLRPPKDQLTLVDAFARVIHGGARAHLLLVGGGDAEYRAAVERRVGELSLGAHVSLLGPRADVAGILRECDIGVLSSSTEGFPLALAEYGTAGLPAVATRVGQCADILDGGRAGIVVDPRNAGQLGAALLALIANGGERRRLGETLQRRVADCYSPDSVLRQLCALYEQLAVGQTQGTSPC